ncbi:hypothetical protein C1884_31205, partial [Pseudomonas sp. GW460-R15]
MQVERRLIKLDGALVVAFHLRLISVLQYFPRPREGLRIHKRIVKGKTDGGQRYESARGANRKPVLVAGVKWKFRARTGKIKG